MVRNRERVQQPCWFGGEGFVSLAVGTRGDVSAKEVLSHVGPVEVLPQCGVGLVCTEVAEIVMCKLVQMFS